MTTEAQKTADAFREAAHNAVERAFAGGHPITVKEGRRIVRVYPTGEREFIGELDHAYRVPKQLSYRLRAKS